MLVILQLCWLGVLLGVSFGSNECVHKAAFLSGGSGGKSYPFPCLFQHLGSPCAPWPMAPSSSESASSGLSPPRPSLSPASKVISSLTRPTFKEPCVYIGAHSDNSGKSPYYKGSFLATLVPPAAFIHLYHVMYLFTGQELGHGQLWASSF